MKLLFHSDQITFNNPVDKKIFEILNPENTKIGYIPSVSDMSRDHFNKRKEWYGKYGVKDLLYFDLDVEYDESKIPELLSCDLIHLSGGDTFKFGESTRRRNFKKVFFEYLKKGGIIVGISAGSYLMTPTFKIREVYEKDETGLANYSGMGFVDFEFLPHYQVKKKYLEKFIEYSKTNNGRRIYLCEDDNGLFVNDDNVEILGNTVILENGKRLR